MFVLPGFDKVYPVKISLQLIEKIESAHGSLYQVAEDMLEQSLPMSKMVEFLKIIYRHAGCDIPEEALEEFLLKQPCPELLIALLLSILDPVDKMGGSTPGEDSTAPEKEFT